LNDRSTRDRLLDAARYLFWERGYAATGIAEILQRAQANAGSFYHFFPGKEALLLAVLDAYLEALEPVIVQPAFASKRDPIERVFAILEGYRERLLQTGCCYGCPLGRLALEIEAENLPAHSRIAANFQGWTGAIRRSLEDARHRFPRGFDLAALATFVLTVMEGGVMQSRSCRRMEPFDQSVAQLRNYFHCLTRDHKERNHDKPARPDRVLRRAPVARRRTGKTRKPDQGR
jgi:TetR/AcrR family transcriptional regulator, transcriptional repressor for nem operon